MGLEYEHDEHCFIAWKFLNKIFLWHRGFRNPAIILQYELLVKSPFPNPLSGEPHIFSLGLFSSLVLCTQVIAEVQHLQCNKVLMNAKDFPHVLFRPPGPLRVFVL